MMSSSTRGTVSKLAAQLQPSILRLSRNLRRNGNRSGDSSMDVQLLKALGQSRGVTVAELAAAEQISRPCISENIKRLVLLGYVKRAQPNQCLVGSPIALHITREGKRYLEGISKRRTDWLTRRLEQLSNAERVALVRATRSLRLILDAAEIGA
jgi:DNA-binding MarR family transcriptional regulator